MLKTLAFCGTMLGLGALLFASELEAADDEIIAPTRIENVQVRDGVNIAVAVYLPKSTGRYPTLFAASPRKPKPAPAIFDSSCARRCNW